MTRENGCIDDVKKRTLYNDNVEQYIYHDKQYYYNNEWDDKCRSINSTCCACYNGFIIHVLFCYQWQFYWYKICTMFHTIQKAFPNSFRCINLPYISWNILYNTLFLFIFFIIYKCLFEKFIVYLRCLLFQ